MIRRKGTIVGETPGGHDQLIAYKEPGRSAWEIRQGFGGGELIGVVVEETGTFSAYRSRGDSMARVGTFGSLEAASQALVR